MIDLAGRRILVIEDEMLIALMLQGMLEELGYQITGMAHTVADALAMIETDTQGIDAATLDINLGGEHSDQVAAALNTHGIPFIIITGYDDPKLFGFEGRPVVRKSFFPEQLKTALQSLEPRAGGSARRDRTRGS